MFTESVLRFAPWSFSKHNVLQTCDLQFHKKYVTHERGTLFSSQSKVGTAVHAVFESTLVETELSSEAVLDAASEKDKLTTEEHASAKAFLPKVDRFRAFVDRFCATHGVTRKLIEFEAAILPNFEATSYNDRAALIRGKVDLGLLTANNDLVIIDHKTGRKKPIDAHAVQLNVYRLFGLALYPQVRSIQCAIHHVSDGSVDWDRSMTAAQIQTQLRPWLETYLNKHDAVLASMASADAPPPSPKPSWACEWCAYATEEACPVGKADADRRRQERDQKKTLRLTNI